MPRPDTANTWPCMDGEAGGVSMNRSLSIHSPPMASCWRPLATRRGVSAPASRDRPHHRGCPASRALGSPDRAPLGRGNRMPSPRRASCPAFIPRAGARARTGTTAAHERRSRTRLRARAQLRARAGQPRTRATRCSCTRLMAAGADLAHLVRIEATTCRPRPGKTSAPVEPWSVTLVTTRLPRCWVRADRPPRVGRTSS